MEYTNLNVLNHFIFIIIIIIINVLINTCTRIYLNKKPSENFEVEYDLKYKNVDI